MMAELSGEERVIFWGASSGSTRVWCLPSEFAGSGT
jgi:hypothetical protein